MARRVRRTVLDISPEEAAQMQADHQRRMADYDFWTRHKPRQLKRYAWTTPIIIGPAEPSYRLDTRGD